MNILWMVMASIRFNYDDPQMKTLIRNVKEIADEPLAKPNPAMIFPFLGKIFPDLIADKKHCSNGMSIRQFMSDAVKKHIETFDKANIRDYIDAFLLEMENSKPGSSFHGSQGYEQLINVLIDIMVAGHTTGGTIKYGIQFLIK